MRNEDNLLFMIVLLCEYLCINSTIELPIIIPSEKAAILRADCASLIPNPTATGRDSSRKPFNFINIFFNAT